VPTKPTLIDLPALASSDKVKESHKDFYNEDEKDEIKAKDEVTSSLIQ